MTVTPACVAAVVDASGSTMNEGEAAELIRYMEALRRSEEARGGIDNLENRVRDLAAADAERARIAAAMAQKQAALAAVAHERGLTQLRGLTKAGLAHDEALLAMFEGVNRPVEGGRHSVWALQAAFQRRFFAPIQRVMVADPEIRKLVENGDQAFADALAREMIDGPGKGGHPKAATLAKAYEEALETARGDRNSLGAGIAKLDRYGGPQTHDSNRVAAVSREQWIADLLPEIDLARTYPGRDPAGVRRMLEDAYDNIAAGLKQRPSTLEETGRIGPANLANSISAARTFHFRDAAAWERYRQKYGRHHVPGAIHESLQNAAHDAALMQSFGPNPEAGFNRLREAARRQAAEDATLTPAERDRRRRALAPTGGSAIANAWAEASGLTRQPVNTRVADIGAGIRNLQRMAKLGGAVLSSAPDIAVRSAALTSQGQPMGEAFLRSLGVLFEGRGSPEMRQLMASLAEGVDGMNAGGMAELMPEDSRPGLLSKATEFTFRVQGQVWWSNRLQAGVARMQAEWLGRNADTPYLQLDSRLRTVLTQHRIGAAEWDAMRPHAVALEGRRYLTPDLARQVPPQALAKLAKDKLEALQKGLAERTARRAAADATEATWVSKRVARFNAELQRAVANAEATSAKRQAAADRGEARIRPQIDEVRLRLDELAEFQAAVAEGRAWTPAGAEPGVPPFTPRAERYLFEGEAATLAARMEGEMRGRLDRLRRAIGRVRQDATRGDVAALEAFDQEWGFRRADLNSFVDRMEQRAKARAAATAAEQADWEPRVRRILDEQRRDLELTFRRFFADEMNNATLQPDARLRRTLYQGTRPGTAAGEFARAVTLFKGYPVAFVQRVLGRAVYGFTADQRGRQASHLGMILAGTTLLGYLSMTAKDAVRGYTPRDPTLPATWLAALTQGGGAGIYGDFLFGQTNRFGNSALETAFGPVASTAAAAANLWGRVRAGEAKAGEAFNLALQNTPLMNLWYARPVLDLLVLNELREALAPGTIARQRQNRERDFGQSAFLPASVYR